MRKKQIDKAITKMSEEFSDWLGIKAFEFFQEYGLPVEIFLDRISECEDHRRVLFYQFLISVGSPEQEALYLSSVMNVSFDSNETIKNIPKTTNE